VRSSALKNVRGSSIHSVFAPSQSAIQDTFGQSHPPDLLVLCDVLYS
jgi:hypothetical protein